MVGYIRMVLLIAGILFVPDSRAEEDLPAGARARLVGKGSFGEGDPRCGSVIVSCATKGGVAYSPDGALLAVASSMGVWLYDAHTGAEVTSLGGDTLSVRSVSFSPDGLTLASVSGRGYETIRLWDMATGQQKTSLQGNTGGVYSVLFSPDGSTLASAIMDGTILLWDIP